MEKLEQGYTFVKKHSEEDEEEIDLMKMLFFVLGKWRVLIIAGIIGCLVGLPIGYYRAQDKGTYDEDMLSSGYTSQIQNYVNSLESVEKDNEKQQNSYIMTLDPDQEYVQGEMQINVLTDTHAAAELAASYLDITTGRAYLNKLQEITGYTGEIRTLAEIVTLESLVSEESQQNISTFSTWGISSTPAPEEGQEGTESAAGSQNGIQSSLSNNGGRSYAKVTYRTKWLTEEESEQFFQWLSTELQNVLEEKTSVFTGSVTYKAHEPQYLPLSDVDLQNAKIEKQEEMADNLIQVQSDFKNLMNRKTSELTNAPTLLDDDEIENYELYWASLTSDTYGRISKKQVCMMSLVVGILFGAVAFLAYCVMFLMSPGFVDEQVLQETYQLEIVGYVSEGKKNKKGLDRLFDRSVANLQPCTWAYMAESISSLLDDEKAAVIVNSGLERNADKLYEELANRGINAAHGDLMTDENVLKAAKEAGGIWLLAETGVTPLNIFESQLHLAQMHGLKVFGVILL